MEYYMDEKWRLSREDPCCRSYSSSNNSSNLMRSASQKSSLQRSYSQKNTASSSSKASLSRNPSKKCANFARKCSNLAKEQKSKLYIVKRCITMLVRLGKHRDS
ncbi:hypothetical protein Leryth_003582 [Lithospermum erythrorhizon]|nr:hypothetical protein Leryth_003582 [Lithospermum erythrorhizon]